MAHNIRTVGSEIDLVATGGIFNNGGGGALLPGGSGSWRVWASPWVDEARGGLVPTSPFPNFYGCTYSGTCVSGITTQPTGNRFIYQAQPTLTVTAATVTGLVNSDTPADAVVGPLSSPSSPVGYLIQFNQDPRFRSEA